MEVEVHEVPNIYHAKSIKLTVYLDTGSGKHRQLINLSELAESLGHDYCATLLGFYVYSGEDCTSAFKGKGKVGPLKKLEKNPKFHTAFRQLGDDWDVKLRVVKQLEEFTCLMYNYSREKSVDVVTMVMVKDSNIVVFILSLLALANTGASNNAGNKGPTPRTFRVRTSTVENGKHGWALVTSVLVTDYGQLLMADFLRNEVKMVSLKNPNTVLSSVRASGNPDSLLQLLDGRVMVCFRNAKKLLIITVNTDSLAVDATLTTNREYAGLAQGPNNTVIASAPKRGSLHGRLDVLDLRGNILRTILDDTHNNYIGVNYLTRFGEDVFLSDHEGDKVRAVNIATGTVTSTFRGLDLNSLNLKEPRDITFDRNGNMYFGVLQSKLCSLCYIQISQGGKATALSWVSADTTSYPYGVTTTSTHLIVSWWHTMGGRSEVTAYQLPF
ncbi:uncharacterized protein [Littorina saxatilis]|uniref:uncharacterized protein n=1 Tax=Littorina saxatilis TaxID=31220 RepID=UPI0038B68685